MENTRENRQMVREELLRILAENDYDVDKIIDDYETKQKQESLVINNDISAQSQNKFNWGFLYWLTVISGVAITIMFNLADTGTLSGFFDVILYLVHFLVPVWPGYVLVHMDPVPFWYLPHIAIGLHIVGLLGVFILFFKDKFKSEIKVSCPFPVIVVAYTYLIATIVTYFILLIILIVGMMSGGKSGDN